MNQFHTAYGTKVLTASILVCSLVCAQGMHPENDPLKYYFDGRRGQVEVGGRFVGLEFHHSRPVPSRISFYYPVANSIDLSTDYWKRDHSMPMVIGLRIGSGEVEWVNRESWSYVLSPHKVTFLKNTDSLQWQIRYEFCLNQPAAVVSILLKNTTKVDVPIELYTQLVMSLRTCQSYTRRDTSWLAYRTDLQTMSAGFKYVDTDSAAVFVSNVGATPNEWASEAGVVGATDEGTTRWPLAAPLQSTDNPGKASRGRGVAAFVYRRTLAPSDSLQIIQIIGSCKDNESDAQVVQLRNQWKDEIKAYDSFVRSKAEGLARFVTGNSEIDRSAVWARGLIAANAHNLQGTIVPMPCPAEYNFFFTHDLLLTNLGAVNFDLDRVKSNLLYVTTLAKDSVIPHAYYWRDDGFKTEYCEPENWNHLWFILVSGSYIRHSLDDSTGRILYPFISKSVREVLTRLHPDGLMYAYRPDWWDIGHIEGPRAYLTALTVRALREYLFISSFLHKQDAKLLEYERIADEMQRALVDRLWDQNDNYLTNYNAGEKDYHFYAGSLIAPVYDLLDRDHALKLVSAAGRQLLDDRIGVRIAIPPDFSTEAVIRKFKFAGDEAGPPYSYANGGVWPHGNAWYALALSSVGKVNEAYEFTRRTMTIDGVAHSPNGLPAMFEYRSSDPNSPAFGTIDKPSFLWAGGMYLQVLYRLLAIDENEWNISIRSRLPSECDSVSCSLTFGDLKTLTLHQSDVPGVSLETDGEEVPSRILPLDLRSRNHWESSGHNTGSPVLVKANAILHSVAYDRNRNRILCRVSSFDSHATRLVFESSGAPTRITVDGKMHRQIILSVEADGRKRSTFDFSGSSSIQTIEIDF